MSPKMQEVKFNYQNITAEVTAESVTVKNKNLFVNTDRFACVVTVAKTERRSAGQTYRRLWSRSRNRPIHCRLQKRQRQANTP